MIGKNHIINYAKSGRRFVSLFILFFAFYTSKACSPILVPTLVSQNINGNNLELSWSSNTTYNCTYYIQVEIVCNGSNFTGTGNPPFAQSATINKTSTPFPYPLQLVNMNTFCPGTLYKFRAREVESNNPSIFGPWTATFTFTTPGVFIPPTISLSANPTLVCVPGSSQLNVNIQNSCGTPAYSWLPAASLSNPSIANPTASPTASTVYTCYVNGGPQGCWTANDTIRINTSPASSCNAGQPVAICRGASTQLNGSGGGTYSWAPASSLSNSTISNPIATPTVTTTYTLTVTQGLCSSSATVVVTVHPLPVVSFTGTDTTGCGPLTVSFTNNTLNSVNCSWTFGDNGTSASCTNPVTHIYTAPGTYSVTLTVTDNFGCVASSTHNNMVTVLPRPVSCFTASPQPATILQPVITFSDCSTGATSWSWGFGDLFNGTSTQQSPRYTYADTGVFTVKQVVCNTAGCCDSTTRTVIIGPYFSIYVPNTFTPNGDNHNEEFFPVGVGIDKANYHFRIFDRWGNQVFQTDNWDKHWDGKTSRGDPVEEDVYVWMIQVQDYIKTSYEYVGHVTVVR